MPSTIAKCVDCHLPIVIACPSGAIQSWHDRCISCAYEISPELRACLPMVVEAHGWTVEDFLTMTKAKQLAEDI